MIAVAPCVLAAAACACAYSSTSVLWCTSYFFTWSFQIPTAYRGRDPYTKELHLDDYEKGDDFEEFEKHASEEDRVILTSCFG